MINRKVAAGKFVKRQSPESGFSHFEGTWDLLESIVEGYLIARDLFAVTSPRFTPGYRDGVILLDLSHVAHWFRSAIVDLTEDSSLTANYAPRRLGEDPFIRVSAKAKKQVAKHVSVVLYRHDVLEENKERETDAEWEIVAIKARISEEEEPMDPYTMARNFLHLKGGTKGDFSAEQFAKSIVYWNNHCMSTSKPKFIRRILSFFKGNK
jgi:Protein of unknown function (DUF3228)